MNDHVPQPAPTPELVLRALHHLIDPEVGVNIVDLGMIAAVEVGPTGDAVIVILPTTPGCPMHEVLAEGARSIVGNLHGITSVDVHFVYSPAWTPDRITAAGREALTNSR
jgi:metal-sulfur cluster biosynthetic enzyme